VVAAADVLACIDELVEFVPDVAIIDLFMPRIGGDDFCRIIRNIDYLQRCCLVLVASSAGGEELDLQAIGVNVCVPRGSVAEMAVRLREVINAPEKLLQVPVQAKSPVAELSRVRQETRELLAKNKALRMILESMSQGIIELFDGRIVYVNPQALVFLGLSPGKVLGRSVAAVFPGQLWLQIAPLFSSKRPDRRQEDRYLPVWLHDRHLLVNRLPVKDEADSQILLLTDVTEIRRMESVVEAANLMDKLGAVFSGIRHELVNPINSLKMALTVLQLQLQDCDKESIAGFVAGCLEDVARLEYLLSALKNYSLFERPEIQPVELGTFFERFTPLVRDEFSRRRIALQVTGGTEGGWAMADPRALHHVLLNLLTNAMDAVGDRPDGLVTISAGRSGNWVEIRVGDNGCGMSEEEQMHLFRPFFTSKEQGTGLGLVIVNKIVSRMNGRIGISSRKDAGTTVTTALPWAGDEAPLPGMGEVAGFRPSAAKKDMGGPAAGRPCTIQEEV
jgi:PAS domain S-box-containing protein